MLMETRQPRGDGGPRPWEDEPNRVAWRDPATGLQCLIRRIPHMGHLCGYVRVQRDHALFGLSRYQRRVWRLRVHGGVTFTGRFRRGREATRGHWVGFDCGHAFDLVPGMLAVYERMPPELVEALAAPHLQAVSPTVASARR